MNVMQLVREHIEEEKISAPATAAMLVITILDAPDSEMINSGALVLYERLGLVTEKARKISELVWKEMLRSATP